MEARGSDMTRKSGRERARKREWEQEKGGEPRALIITGIMQRGDESVSVCKQAMSRSCIPAIR